MTSRPWWGTRPSDSYGLTRLEAAGGLTDDRLIRRLVWQTLTSQSFGPVGPKNILCDTDMTAHDDSVYSGGRDARRVYKGLSDPSHLRKKKKKNPMHLLLLFRLGQVRNSQPWTWPKKALQHALYQQHALFGPRTFTCSVTFFFFVVEPNKIYIFMSQC